MTGCSPQHDVCHLESDTLVPTFTPVYQFRVLGLVMTTSRGVCQSGDCIMLEGGQPRGTLDTTELEPVGCRLWAEGAPRVAGSPKSHTCLLA